MPTSRMPRYRAWAADIEYLEGATGRRRERYPRVLERWSSFLRRDSWHHLFEHIDDASNFFAGGHSFRGEAFARLAERDHPCTLRGGLDL